MIKQRKIPTLIAAIASVDNSSFEAFCIPDGLVLIDTLFEVVDGPVLVDVSCELTDVLAAGVLNGFIKVLVGVVVGGVVVLLLGVTPMEDKYDYVQ